MGYLRFLLALSVIFSHTDISLGVSGNIAVEAFFIISGFYMALVLKEKYFHINNYYKLFLSNRLLRLYPMYWIVLLLIIIASVLYGSLKGQYGSLQVFIDHWHGLKLTTLLFFIISNVIVLGQDILFFFTINNAGGLQFTQDTFSSDLVLYRFLIDPPLWTVSLEIMFYIISPFFVKLRVKTLVIITTILFLIRFYLKIMDVNYDPFIYRFFPLQIGFFLLGIISYNLYNIIRYTKISIGVFYFAIVYIAVFTVSFAGLKDSEVKDFIYLSSVFCMVPVLFKFTSNSKIDKWLGELSYPMYISHILIVLCLKNVFKSLHSDERYFGFYCVLVTITFSHFLISIIGKRLESYRASRVTAKKLQTS